MGFLVCVFQDVAVGAEADEYTRLTTSRAFVTLPSSESFRKDDQAPRKPV